MKWIKTYTRLLESNLEPQRTVFVKYEEFPTHLKKFKEVLVDKFEDSVFDVLDDNDVKLKELVPIKNLDEKESNEKWIILHYVKEEYHWGKPFEDFFLRVYVLEENEDVFEKVLAFDAKKYPTIKKWKAVNADDQYQYKEVEVRMNIFSKKEIQLHLDNPRKVLIYKFSNMFNEDDATNPAIKYGSGYKGNLAESYARNSFTEHTREVDFAENFYIDNLIRSLQKNSNISNFIQDDGSIKDMPGVHNGCRVNIPVRFNRLVNKEWVQKVGLPDLEDYMNKCRGKGNYVADFATYKCIPLTVFLEELINILGFDFDFEKLRSKASILISGLRGFYWKESGESCPNWEEVGTGKLCDFGKFVINTEEKPKENLRYIIFDLVSKGIPQEKAKKIYNQYKDDPTAVVEPKLIFELPK